MSHVFPTCLAPRMIIGFRFSSSFHRFNRSSNLRYIFSPPLLTFIPDDSSSARSPCDASIIPFGTFILYIPHFMPFFNILYTFFGTTFSCFNHILGTTFSCFNHILGTSFSCFNHILVTTFSFTAHIVCTTLLKFITFSEWSVPGQAADTENLQPYSWKKFTSATPAGIPT